MKGYFKRIIALTATGLLASLFCLYGQGQKTIVKKGISSITVEEYFIEEGIDEPVIESVERYDHDGELIERKEMNKRGEIQKWEEYSYNEDGKLVEQRFLDDKGRVERIEKTIYKDGLRVEKQYFNRRNKMYKKKVYLYEYHQ